MSKKIHLIIILIFILVCSYVLYLIFWKDYNNQKINYDIQTNDYKDKVINKSISDSTKTVVLKDNTVVDNNNSSSISLLEISKHNTINDCWMKINNSVYDLSSYVNDHPAGRVIVKGCGNDATEMFYDVRKHNKTSVANLLEKFLIGQAK